MVAHVHSKFEQAKKLMHLPLRRAAEIVGVSHCTIWKWRQRKKPPRQAAPRVSIADLGLSRCDGRKCNRCGHEMWVMAMTGLCVECEVLQLAKLGTVEIRE